MTTLADFKPGDRVTLIGYGTSGIIEEVISSPFGRQYKVYWFEHKAVGIVDHSKLRAEG